MRHLDIARLLEFADPGTKKEARAEAMAHLADCEECRSEYISLMTLRSALRSVPERFAAFALTEKCIPGEVMGDFLGGRLPAPDNEAYSAHVAECDMCFERASFFTRSTVRMTEGVMRTAGTPERFLEAVLPARRKAPAVVAPSFTRRGVISRWLRSPIPAYAFAASVLLFLVFGPGRGPGDVIDIGSETAFSIYERPAQAGPSFGFPDAGKKVGQTPSGLVARKSRDGGLSFSWNAVKGADEYGFIVSEITPGGMKSVYETRTAESGVELPAQAVSAGRAYAWKVTAEADGKVFMSSGQFVLAR